VSDPWPHFLWTVRHGQSAGNVARDAAHNARQDRIALTSRDVDVPLSKLGREQSIALGQWIAMLPAAERPDAVLVSPYRRAIETAELVRECGGVAADVALCVDERLREKEFGILDGLTSLGIANHYPEQAEFRRLLGKFYYRPPGGESWCDVILRLRSMLDTISLHYAGRRLMIVAHQVVVLCLRYILENLDEAQILAIDRLGDVANCAVTQYDLDRREQTLVLRQYNFTVPMEQQAVPVTSAKDTPVAARG
jgi:broad specificity phosphatase PhoE